MKSEYLSSFALLVGVALIGLSYAWPQFSDGSVKWSEKQALELMEVRASLHGGSHEHNAGESHAADDSAQAELETRLKQLESELESAQSGGAATAQVLWSLGVLLVVAGAVLYFVNRGD